MTITAKSSPRKRSNWIGVIITSLGFWLFPTTIATVPAFSAEQISASYGILDFSLSVNDLETFAKEGKITDNIAPYIESIDAKNLAKLRQLLQERLEVTPTLISQFTGGEVGRKVLDRMGKILQTETDRNGATALRTALISAASDPQGLTLINIFRKFPDRTVKINLTDGIQLMEEVIQLGKNRDALIKVIGEEVIKETETVKIDFSQLPDLRKSGSFQWEKAAINFNDRVRNRSLWVDIYLPKRSTKAIKDVNSPRPPLIIISHGAAGDRTTFAYLAEHLASYGFAVAVVEHPGDSSKLVQQFFSGAANSPQPIELINRPSEIKFILDELTRIEYADPTFQGRLDPQNVGIIGHSVGGYTALSLAGANINFEQLKKDCNDNQLLNLSLLVQCEAIRLPLSNYAFQDPRVKAVLAINPLTSSIFGENEISKIKIPTMLVASSDDIFTPAVTEQIQPFTWLTSANKYLVSVQKATHFSFTATTGSGANVLPLPADLIGPDSTLARPYINVLSTAFFQTYLSDRAESSPYLSAGYARSISQEPFKIDLIQSLTAAQFTQAIDSVKPK